MIIRWTAAEKEWLKTNFYTYKKPLDKEKAFQKQFGYFRTYLGLRSMAKVLDILKHTQSNRTSKADADIVRKAYDDGLSQAEARALVPHVKCDTVNAIYARHRAKMGGTSTNPAEFMEVNARRRNAKCKALFNLIEVGDIVKYRRAGQVIEAVVTQKSDKCLIVKARWMDSIQLAELVCKAVTIERTEPFSPLGANGESEVVE
jgi:hypothetical protein